jgi:hypothetical protein
MAGRAGSPLPPERGLEEGKVCFDVRPHPGLLPRGEGTAGDALADSNDC